MAFDIAEARKSGYSDSEIESFLDTQFDVKSARSAGYNLDEIAGFIAGESEPQKPLFDLETKYTPALGTKEPSYKPAPQPAANSFSNAITPLSSKSDSFLNTPNATPPYSPENESYLPVNTGSEATAGNSIVYPAPVEKPMGSNLVEMNRGEKQNFVEKYPADKPVFDVRKPQTNKPRTPTAFESVLSGATNIVGGVAGELAKPSPRLVDLNNPAQLAQYNRGAVIDQTLRALPIQAEGPPRASDDDLKTFWSDKSTEDKAAHVFYANHHIEGIAKDGQETPPPQISTGIDAAINKKTTEIGKFAQKGLKNFSEAAFAISNAMASTEEQAQGIRDKIHLMSKHSPDLANAWSRGKMGTAIDILGAQAAARGDAKSAQIVQDIKDEFETKVQQTPASQKDFFNKTLNATVEILPAMIAGGALSAIPIVGPALGASMWATQGAGNSFNNLIKDGVDVDTARKAAAVIGPIYAGIELVQLGQLTRVPGVKEGIEKGFGAATRKALTEYGKDWIKEWNEEGAQGVVQTVGEEVAKGKDPYTVAKLAMKAYIDNAVQSMAPLGLMGIPGKTGGLARSAGKIRGQARTNAGLTQTGTKDNAVAGSVKLSPEGKIDTKNDKNNSEISITKQNKSSEGENKPVETGKTLADVNLTEGAFWSKDHDTRNAIYSELSPVEKIRVMDWEEEPGTDAEDIKKKILEYDLPPEPQEEIQNVDLAPTDGNKEISTIKEAVPEKIKEIGVAIQEEKGDQNAKETSKETETLLNPEEKITLPSPVPPAANVIGSAVDIERMAKIIDGTNKTGIDLARITAKEIEQAATSKDPELLEKHLAKMGNSRGERAVFKQITGVEIPSTITDARIAIMKYVGDEKYRNFNDDRVDTLRNKNATTRALMKDEVAVHPALKEEFMYQADPNSKTVLTTWKSAIEDKVKKGFVQIEEFKSGNKNPVTRFKLTNPKTKKNYVLPKIEFADYAKYLINKQSAIDSGPKIDYTKGKGEKTNDQQKLAGSNESQGKIPEPTAKETYFQRSGGTSDAYAPVKKSTKTPYSKEYLKAELLHKAHVDLYKAMSSSDHHGWKKDFNDLTNKNVEKRDYSDATVKAMREVYSKYFGKKAQGALESAGIAPPKSFDDALALFSESKDAKQFTSFHSSYTQAAKKPVMRSSVRKYSATKMPDNVTQEYLQERFFNELQVDARNSLSNGWRHNSIEYTGSYEGWVKDFNKMTDANVPPSMKAQVVSDQGLKYLQSIVDAYTGNIESAHILEALGLDSPTHADDVIDWLTRSMGTQAFDDYHKEYVKEAQTEELAGGEYEKAYKIFTKDPKKLKPAQVELLESTWGASMSDVLSQMEAARNAEKSDIEFAKTRSALQGELDLLNGETIDNQQDMDLFNRRWKPEDEKPKNTKLSDVTGDLFAGTATEDKRTESQKAIAEEISRKEKEKKAKQRENIFDGSPLFSENEKEARVTEQSKLDLSKEPINGTRTSDTGDTRRNSNDASATKALSAILERSYGVADGIEAVEEPDTEAHRAAGVVARTFGANLTWFSSTRDIEKAMDSGIGGVYVRNDPKLSNRIFINEITRNVPLQVVGHELLHRMDSHYPDLYHVLEQTFVEEANEKARYKVTTKVINENMSERQAREEVIADFVGDEFASKSFWERLHDNSPEAFRAAIQIIRELIAKAQKALRIADYADTTMFEDVAKVRAVLVDVIKEYYTRENGELPSKKEVAKIEAASATKSKKEEDKVVLFSKEEKNSYKGIDKPEDIGYTKEDLETTFGSMLAVRKANYEIQQELELFASGQQTDLFYDRPDSGRDSGKPTSGTVRPLRKYGEINRIGYAGESPIAHSWKKHRRIDFVGKQVVSPRNVAALFSVYRHPSLEHVHIVYLNDNDEIVAHNAMSSGLANSAQAYQFNDRARSFEKIKNRMLRLNATKFYLIHNHPSGNVTASGPDRRVTSAYNENVPGFAGHVILDHSTFGFIDKNDVYRDFDYMSSGKAPDIAPELEQRPAIYGASDVAQIGYQTLHSDVKAAVLILSNANNILAWYPINDIKNVNAQNIHQIVRNHGGVSAVFVTDGDEYFAKATNVAVQNRKKPFDVILDVIKVQSFKNTPDQNLKNRVTSAQSMNVLIDIPSGYMERPSANRTGFIFEPKKTYNTNDKIYTPEFKKWFGDWENDPENASKVVDEDGRPIVVYHGTAKTFVSFNKSKALDKEGRRMEIGWGKGKFYFADTPEAASVAASGAEYYGKGKNQNVMPVYLDIKKPISASDYTDRVNKLVISGAERDTAIKNIDKEITKDGYDGIIDTESGGLAVFNSTQIKSVIGNNGEFNSGNPDIRFSKQPKLSPLSTSERVRDAKTEAVDRLNNSIEYHKAVASLHFELAHIPEEYLSHRAIMQVKINKARELEIEEIKTTVYEYAAMIGLKGIPYNMVDTLLKNTDTIGGLKKAIAQMDEVYRRAFRKEKREEVLDLIRKKNLKLNKLSNSKIPSVTDLEANRKLQEYLDALVGVKDKFEADKLRTILTWLTRDASKQANTKDLADLPVSVQQWMEDTTNPFPTIIEDAVKGLYAKTIDAMSIDQLQKVIDDIKSIEDTGRTRREEEERIRKEKEETAITAMSEEITKKSVAPSQKLIRGESLEEWSKQKKMNKWIDIAKNLAWHARDIDRIIIALTGKVKNTALETYILRPLADAQSAYKKGMQRVFDFHKKTYGHLNIDEIREKPWKNIHIYFRQENDVVVKEEQIITQEMGMFIYANSVNRTQKEHLLATINRSDRVDAQRVMDEICDALPQELKDAVEKQWNYFDKDQWDRMNEIFSWAHQVDMGHEQNYMPATNLERAGTTDNVEVDMLARAVSQATSDIGSTKNRIVLGPEETDGDTPGSVLAAPYRHMRYFDVVIPSMREAEHYIAFYKPVWQSNRYLGNQTLLDALIAHDKAVVPVLKDWLKSLAYGRYSYGQSKHHSDTWISALRLNAGKCLVLGRATVLFLQASSLPRGFITTNPKYMVSAMAMMARNPKNFYDIIALKSPEMLTRTKDFEQAIAEWLESTEGKRFIQKLNPIDKMTEGLGNAIGEVDKFWASFVWYARYSEAINRGFKENDAIYEADKIIRKTQSGGGLIAANSLQRGGDVQRAFTQFLSDAIKGYNTLDEVIQGWKDYSTAERTQILIFGLLLPAAITLTIRTGGEPWKDPEGLVRELVSQVTGGMFIMGQLIDLVTAMALDEVRTLRGVKPNRNTTTYVGQLDVPAIALFNSFGDNLKKGTAAKELPKKVLYFADAAAQALGLPGEGQAKRLATGMGDFIKTKDPRYLALSKGALAPLQHIMVAKLKTAKTWQDKKSFLTFWDNMGEAAKSKFLVTAAREMKVTEAVVTKNIAETRADYNTYGATYKAKKMKLNRDYVKGEISKVDREKKFKEISLDQTKYIESLIKR